MARSDSKDARLRVAALRNNAPNTFDIRPDDAARTALAQELGLTGLRKLRLEGEIRPEGRGSWRLAATLGATVTQPCVVTLAPVTTRIDESIERIYRPEDSFRSPEAGSEIETPEDESEPLPDTIDLNAVLAEALSLALPLYPHSEGAEAAAAGLAAEDAADKAQAEAEDERPNPFAALAQLRGRLDPEDDNGENGTS